MYELKELQISWVNGGCHFSLCIQLILLQLQMGTIVAATFVRAAVVGLQMETVLNDYWQQVVIYFCWLASANIEHCQWMCVTHIWEMRSPFVSSIKTENWMPSTTKNAPTWRTLLIYSVICYWIILLNLGLLSCDIDLKTKRNTTFYYLLRLPYYPRKPFSIGLKTLYVIVFFIFQSQLRDCICVRVCACVCWDYA